MLGLEELGLTKEDLQERVVDGLCERLLSSSFCDEDGDETRRESSFKKKLNERIQEKIDEAFKAMCEQHVAPHVETLIANMVIQVTNRYGEPKSPPLTLREYLVKTGEDWLMEGVDFSGESNCKRGSYGWKESQTRLAHLINKHIQYELENGLKALMKDPLAQFGKAVGETAKMQMLQIADKLQVNVTTK